MMNESSEGNSRASLGQTAEGVSPQAWAGPIDRGSSWYVCLCAIVASITSFLIYLHRGEILLFGDAVAHINIARRVFDSRYPGLLQLGTVWLPLPHLLMMPFVIVNSWWQNGAAASIPSMIAYVLGVAGIFRLVRDAMAGTEISETKSKLTAYFAAAIYGLNPNLLYLQATAMTESLYLALFIWAIVNFGGFWRAIGEENDKSEALVGPSLRKCGIYLFGACLTRYDGWFVAAIMAAVVVLVYFRTASTELTKGSEIPPRKIAKQLLVFLLLVSAAPVTWLVYNGIVYRNPLEFANGPYSAKAIEQKTAVPGFPPHPGSHNLVVAGAYFSKSGLFSMAEGNWQQGWLWLAVLGTAWVLWQKNRLAPLLLLWLPLPFYMLSVAYGGVPIYVPTWWPFSFYNIRYGVQLLPALAVFVAIAASFVVSMMVTDTGKRMIAMLAVGFVVVSYAGVWRSGPVAFREAWVNSRTRLQLENQLTGELKKLPRNSTLLMYLGEHVGSLQDAGIPLRRAISESSHRVWVQPADAGGLWERTLADPPAHVDFVIAFEGDPVWRAVHDRNLPELARIEVTGQKTVLILRAR